MVRVCYISFGWEHFFLSDRGNRHHPTVHRHRYHSGITSYLPTCVPACPDPVCGPGELIRELILSAVLSYPLASNIVEACMYSRVFRSRIFNAGLAVSLSSIVYVQCANFRVLEDLRRTTLSQNQQTGTSSRKLPPPNAAPNKST